PPPPAIYTLSLHDALPISAYKVAGCPGGLGLNKAAFSAPTAGVQGTLGRNVLRGFAWHELDMTIRRQFPIHEAIALQFRADVGADRKSTRLNSSHLVISYA